MRRWVRSCRWWLLDRGRGGVWRVWACPAGQLGRARGRPRIRGSVSPKRRRRRGLGRRWLLRRRLHRRRRLRLVERQRAGKLGGPPRRVFQFRLNLHER